MKIEPEEQQIIDYVYFSGSSFTDAAKHFGITYHKLKMIFLKVEHIKQLNLDGMYRSLAPIAKEFKASYKDLIIPSDTSLTVGDYIKYYK